MLKNVIESESKFSLSVYPKRELVIERGKGAVVWDENGRKYIDCVAGHGVASIGHCNRSVYKSIRKQAKQLISCPGIFYNRTRSEFIEKLIGITPSNLTKVFVCNSGTETMEAAIKFTRLTTGRTDFVSAMKGFHGRTMGALSATFNPKYKEGVLPLLPGFSFAPFNNFEKLIAKVNENTAGVILEIIQGEGGVNVGDEKYFQKIQAFCSDKKLLLIIDEVQTGFCRTGKMFAIEHVGVEPDMLCLSKAIAGGVPMGAVVCTDKISITIGKHGSTFGGNPLSCAAGIAAIDFMKKHNLATQARQKGEYLVQRLEKANLRRIKEIRGKGLMIGIELSEPVKQYVLDLLNTGLLVLPAGRRVIRLLPPLVVTYRELDFVAEKLIEVLS